MVTRSDIKEEFPALAQMGDKQLRDQVIDVWLMVADEGNYDSIYDVPWAPHYREVVGDQKLVPHIDDVLQLATDITDTLESIRDISVDRDVVIAGALLHDISKFFEFEGERVGEIREMIGHPFFGVYLLETVGMPIEVQHIVVSHTPSSSEAPRTIEARIVRLADQLAEEGIFQETTGAIKHELDN